MAELAHCESADSSEVLGKNPNSVSNLKGQWERIPGLFTARYTRTINGEWLSEYYNHHCPRCDNHRRPNVSRSSRMPSDWQKGRDQNAWEHHCNRCKVTWMALQEPFCSSHSHVK